MAAVGFYTTGSFAHIPAYMPSETSCVASTILVPQTTITATNNHIPVKTPLPTTMQNDNGTHRHSGGHDSDDDDDDDDDNIVMGTGVGSGFILLVLLVVVIAITVICFFRLAIAIVITPLVSYVVLYKDCLILDAEMGKVTTKYTMIPLWPTVSC